MFGKSSFSSRVFRAFTLVELLVVISVIALLLSILMPTLQKARQAGRKIVCLGNLRQMGLVQVLYTQENNGKFVPWSDRFLIDGGDSNKRADYYLHTVIKDKKIFQCPNRSKFYNSESTYGWNLMLTGYPSGMPPVIKNWKLQETRNPSAVICMFDIDDDGYRRVIGNQQGMWCFWRGAMPTYYPNRQHWKIQPLQRRHDDGDNILFADGHSSWYRTKEANDYDTRWNSITFEPKPGVTFNR